MSTEQFSHDLLNTADQDVIRKCWQLLRAGQVRRFHTLPTPIHQTTAEHAGRVALLGWELSDGTCSARFMAAALMHDLPESAMGDVPSPTLVTYSTDMKKEYDEIEQFVARRMGIVGAWTLEPWERELLSFCDTLDGFFTTAMQSRSNPEAMTVALRYSDYIQSRWPLIYNEWQKDLTRVLMHDNPPDQFEVLGV